MFDPVDPKQSFPALEEGILQYWRSEDMFRRSLHQRRGGEVFSFYDGPPFATGLPHYGHLLAGTIKDVIPRYQTMRGKYVERRFGWDCHGLPIENLIEKEQGMKSKKDIEAMGVARFNELCRGSVQRYTKEWRQTVERVGRWVDMDNDYRTLDPEYMESIWWVFKNVHDKGLIYEGYKPMHVCPRCVTPLSNFEVTTGYKDVTDVSVIAKFEMKGTEGTKGTKEFFLAWTTTPWTLPGNLFLAVASEVMYTKVTHEGEVYILAEDLVENVFKGKEFEVQGKPFKGSTLVGKTYVPLFPYFVDRYPDAFRVVAGEFVTTTDGTGIVHIAPGFGDDDFAVGKREGAAMLQHVTMDGHFIKEVTDFAGMEVKAKDDPTASDKKIAEWLKKHGNLFATLSYKHAYPHCWRCDSPLLNYATTSWFVRVEQIKPKLLEHAKSTEWMPSHLRDGRFGKWLEGARDWAISRNRYWGTPLPVWRAGKDGELEVIGSKDDLMARKLLRFTKVTVLRHAQSQNNTKNVYEGLVPGSSLSDLGKKQAEAAGKRLAQGTVDVIYCSPLARTRETAEAIAKATGARVIVDQRLQEIQFGPEYEGKTYDFSDLAFLKNQREEQAARPTFESIYHRPGMEKGDEVFARVREFLQEMLPRHRSEHVVVVTHADPVLHVRRFFTGQPHDKLAAQDVTGNAQGPSFHWDHDKQLPLDLHKEVVDDIQWTSGDKEGAVSLTLVRHGETEWNAQKLVQGGNADKPLSEKGKTQAQELGAQLKGQRFDAIVCSPLGRAKATAEALSQALEQPIDAFWDELRERDCGDWSGKTEDDILAAHPSDVEGLHLSFHPATPNGGESLSAFCARVERAAERLLKEYAGKKVLVVCHGGTIRAMETLIDNLAFREAAVRPILNCSVTEKTLTPFSRRIPEVLDCWFESGSMPYAQSHFPFASTSGDLPPGFPADFIAEGVDQTRLWFYTLMVLSTILYDRAPYRNVVVNGIVLADDGRKMSKRLKNYPDPVEVVNRHGADALRFALMSSPAVRAEDLRFSENVVSETVRAVILPLWNAYGFFVTYANAAPKGAPSGEFTPVTAPHVSNHPLDKAMRAEAQDLVNRMTEQLDAYDLSSACSEIHASIDMLTNWYIRLSRRRFAGKGASDAEEAAGGDHEQDRLDALTTLYDVLLTVCRVLSPFCPFVTDAIYLNLAPEPHGSVHLTDWPQSRPLDKQETRLLKKTRLLRSVVSLGLKIRSEKSLKVRLPLKLLTVAIPPKLREEVQLDDEDLTLLRQELNVKEVAFANDPKELAEVIALVDAKKVGPRLGGRVQELIQAGKRGEFTVRDDDSVLIQDETLAPEEVTISYRGKEGSDVAADRGVVVLLDTHVTEELHMEGLVRDLVRTVQKLRKEAGLSISDTIALSIEGCDALLKTYEDLIARETGARFQKNDGEVQELDLDGTIVRIKFAKA